MEKLVILQSRLNSARLPGKALLPVANIPMFVLAALRAANSGLNVVVATSMESDDDLIEQVAAEFGLTVFRGPLEDVLSRFTLAAAEYADNCIIVRLTADNIVPDGSLIDEIIQEFLETDADYICTSGDKCGLPYGVSVEVTWLKHLREADRCADEDGDREHVTPFIRRKYGVKEFTRYQQLEMQLYRTTIDTYLDYTFMAHEFHKGKFGVDTPWQLAIEVLKKHNYQPAVQKMHSDFVLGTAQLGMKYGINSNGQPTAEMAKELLEAAILNGCTHIDTARAYGQSEHILGKYLNKLFPGRASITTKLSPMENLSQDTSPELIALSVENSLFVSLLELRQEKIDTVLLHRTAQLEYGQGAVLRKLAELKTQGRIGVIGVSVQTPQELAFALDFPDVQHIQMPFNIFDTRWDEVLSFLVTAKKERKIVVHVRSVFLQGLLLTNNVEKWNRAGVIDPTSHIEWLRQSSNYHNRKNVADLCVAWVRACDWVDGVVIGCETRVQLVENITLFEKKPLRSEEVARLIESRPKLPVPSLNPATWRL